MTNETRFSVGDTVNVLAAVRLPLEVVKHTGAITAVIPPSGERPTTLYAIDGLIMRYSANVLRKAGQ
jgi:hypothetical protein